jgi:hypothetical protein
MGFRKCKKCTGQFEITDVDLKFYDKVSPIFNGQKYLIPPPTLCPDCRCQRRLIWRNERKLYHRKCDLCGQELISIVSPDKPYKAYCRECFYGDRWDPMKFGRDFNFNQSFFDQFKDLILDAPALTINHQRENENCEFTNLVTFNKNCYLIFAASENEDSYYCTYLHRSKNISDCFFVFDCELCYECIDCYNCFKLFYSENCKSCSESYFLFNCKGCSNCFGSVNLVNKSFHIFNQPYPKDQYFLKINEFLFDKQKFKEAKKIFYDLKTKLPHKYYSGQQNQSFTGDHISYSKNVYNSYDCNYLEDSKFCTWLHESKDCYDCYAWGQTGELGYENHLCGNNFHNIQFSDSSWNDISNLLYCHYCTNNSKNLFGCASLKHKEYCILNKQYTKEEYETLVPKIIEHMQRTGEWGEFFPMSISPFAYNETVAQEYFPLTKEEAVKAGADWKNEDLISRYEGQKVEIPFLIKDVKDEITKQILTCKTCGKNYKIISQELDLYRKINIGLPENCFNCRYEARRNLRNPRKLWDRNCAKCGASIKTTYAAERPEIVYCEECYLKEVY